ncbi:MAG: hypothetical protein JST40_02915 [Armatimonadetes bacterium]|nr:hypothetical protein [Armatimonadota bacterium]
MKVRQGQIMPLDVLIRDGDDYLVPFLGSAANVSSSAGGIGIAKRMTFTILSNSDPYQGRSSVCKAYWNQMG